MDGALALKFFCAFIFVIGLMMLFAWGIKKMGLAGQSFIPAGKRRLKIIEILPVDHRRRLVLLRRDDREHLLIVSTDGETVIETNIPMVEDAAADLLLSKEQKNV